MMSRSLNVVVVQPNLHWLNPSANLDHLDQLIKQHIESTSTSPDIIVLPEMFTSGFTQQPEPLYGDQNTIRWMQAQARDWQTAMVGSIACEIEKPPNSDCHIGDNYYVNRLLFVQPSGEVTYYDKCHLFRMGGEHERYQAGQQRTIVNYQGWRILLTICYDLRFPVFCRNQQDYDLMLCVANWPAVRRHPWRTLLQARAIENQAYVIGANRVGKDGNDLLYSGDSLVVDMQGHLLADGEGGNEVLLSCELSYDDLEKARTTFPVAMDADKFKLL